MLELQDAPNPTSPRNLQEMTSPVMEGPDITNISGISMKQYEEQLQSLRKENFHLKLRIYFLEEKLGSGAPPAVQGLLEHNVRLQVEVEELRRQLSDKQELLAAAAEAIDVLEQQGSVSTDSVELKANNISDIKNDTNTQKQVDQKQDGDDTCAESESAGDYLAVTVNNDDLDELSKLRRENRKALMMVKACMKKIQKQDKEIKKIELDKELTYSHVSDSQVERYEEILKYKDEHIKDLENKILDMQKYFEDAQNNDSGNLQQLLTRRLQALTHFLDKLLLHKCVLGEDKKKLAKSILEQSLNLQEGLELDESNAPDELTMDESNFDMSQSFKLGDLTMMFGHHATCGGNKKYSMKKQIKRFPEADIMSESECWSEPDRNVSLARVGLCDTGVSHEASTSELKYKSRRNRPSYGSRSDDVRSANESANAAFEQFNQINNQNQLLERDNNDLQNKLDIAMKQMNALVSENKELKVNITSEHNNSLELNKTVEAMKMKIAALELKAEDIEQKYAESLQFIENIRTERQELEATFMETERMLRRAADEATVQASEAALERAKAQHDRLQIERELEETRDKLAVIMEINSRLEIELAQKVAADAGNKIVVLHDVIQNVHSEEERPTSPDQGIDSDRLSSLEQTDAITLSPRSLYEENITLKQKLSRTKATLAETLTQLNAANLRKRSVQHAICREIHKTQGVLRKARDQFENQNKN